MTIEYSVNIMGPVSIDWFEKRDTTESWVGGRIDIYGVPDEHYPIDYSLPIMHGDSLALFDNWLCTYTTEELVSFEKIVSDFENDTGHTIRWAHEEFGDIL